MHGSTDLPFYARSARATFSCSQSYLAICLGYFGFWPSLICILHYLSGYWAGCLSTRMSTSGYCVFLGDNLLSWSAKQQHTLSRSSAEAEYRGVANVVAETAWLRNLPRELHSPLSTVTLVYCDNVSVVYMSANVVQHQRTKHIEIDIHFVHDMVTAGQVSVLHIPSRYQYADIFTIRLPIALFEEFRSSLSGFGFCSFSGLKKTVKAVARFLDRVNRALGTGLIGKRVGNVLQQKTEAIRCFGTSIVVEETGSTVRDDGGDR
ncbi:ribonuclease H-like domain-containing protein [Tanacetum coccineum]